MSMSRRPCGAFTTLSRGIAIRSSFRRFIESIVDEKPVLVGEVHYIDFTTEVIPSGNALEYFVRKRKSFDFERELRAFHLSSAPADGEFPWVTPVAIDLDRLVEGIFVAPGAPGWFAELVRDIIAKYGHSWPVDHSRMDATPIF
jgi:hypothetical protein